MTLMLADFLGSVWFTLLLILAAFVAGMILRPTIMKMISGKK